LRFLPGMTERRHGGILFVASLAGFAPGGPDMAIYYATKAALLSFSDALSVETAGTGVTISALCPGPTATDFGKRAGFSAGSAVDAYGRMSAEDVAAIGHAAFRAGKRRVGGGLEPWPAITPLSVRLRRIPVGASITPPS
jgi:short-subunit dehydrogenase